MSYLGSFKCWWPMMVKLTDGNSQTYVWAFWKFKFKNLNYVKRFHRNGLVRFRIYQDGIHYSTYFLSCNHSPQYVRDKLIEKYGEQIIVIKEAVSIT